MVLYRALLDCLNDLGYSIMIELLASVNTCSQYSTGRQHHGRQHMLAIVDRQGDSLVQCLSDNIAMPCSTL